MGAAPRRVARHPPWADGAGTARRGRGRPIEPAHKKPGHAALGFRFISTDPHQGPSALAGDINVGIRGAPGRHLIRAQGPRCNRPNSWKVERFTHAHLLLFKTYVPLANPSLYSLTPSSIIWAPPSRAGQSLMPSVGRFASVAVCAVRWRWLTRASCPRSPVVAPHAIVLASPFNRLYPAFRVAFVLVMLG